MPCIPLGRTDKFLTLGIGTVIVMLAVSLMTGPRGWRRTDPGEGGKARESHLRIDGESGEFTGILDYPLNGKLTLYINAHAKYRVFVNEQPVAINEDSPHWHVKKDVAVDLKPGLVPIRVEVGTPEGGGATFFELFWSWGGEGRYIQPAGGQYLLPRELTNTERFFTHIWRRKFILLSGFLALVLLIHMLPARRQEEMAV